MTNWTIRVSFGDFPLETMGPDMEKWETLMATMRPLCGMGSLNGQLRVFDLVWHEESDRPEDLVATAAPRARQLMGSIGCEDYPILKVVVEDPDRPTETQQLHRYADIAAYAGLTRQRIAQLAKTDDRFPKAVMTLSDGTPLFKPLEAIEYGQLLEAERAADTEDF